MGFHLPVDELAELQTEGKFCTMNAILIVAMVLKKVVSPLTLQNLKSLGNFLPLTTLSTWMGVNTEIGLFMEPECVPHGSSLLNWLLADGVRDVPESSSRGQPTRMFIAQIVDSQKSRGHAVVFDLEAMQIMETDPRFPRPLSLAADKLSETLKTLDLCAVHKAHRVWVRSPRRKRKR